MFSRSCFPILLLCWLASVVGCSLVQAEPAASLVSVQIEPATVGEWTAAERIGSDPHEAVMAAWPK